MPGKKFVALYRLCFALLVVIAISAQFLYKHPSNPTQLVNFFSYFTILSNIFAATVFLLLGFGVRKVLRVSVASLRLPAVVFMAITGIVVLVLLEKYASLALTLPWVGIVLHRIMSVVVFLDWLIVPPAKKIRYRDGFWLLTFPLAYAGYTLWRGPLVGWYPYPFLDPQVVGSYQVVFLYIAGISIGTLLFSQFVIFVGNKLRDFDTGL